MHQADMIVTASLLDAAADHLEHGAPSTLPRSIVA